MTSAYDVAAYIWPSYHDEPRAHVFWPGHEGEWINVRTSKPKFPGHKQPRRPLWGYQNEADPRVMEMQIDAAADHGVNVFAYDWYWYDRAPFLEACLNEGFLQARNNHRMKFFLMWANHNVTHLWDRRQQEPGGVIWNAAWDREEFEIIGRRWIDRYFTHPCYYCIEGKPLLSIFRPQTMVDGLGGVDATRDALQWLNEQCRAAGLRGVHLQAIFTGGRLGDTMGLKGEERASEPSDMEPEDDLHSTLPFASMTNYQWVSMAAPEGTYADWSERARAGERMAAERYDIPFFPSVSVGWDNNARFPELKEGYVVERNPEVFEENLKAARAVIDQRDLDPKLVLINSWNEWTEDSYLLPDREFGYGYLEAVRNVFGACENEDI
ncbi:MAG: glycoside hydrolase family 99-like domain-containing protein [Candidatus Brocadiia bacterium]